MRLQVLQEMKYIEVPVVELHLTERKERELNLRLNKLVTFRTKHQG